MSRFVAFILACAASWELEELKPHENAQLYNELNAELERAASMLRGARYFRTLQRRLDVESYSYSFEKTMSKSYTEFSYPASTTSPGFSYPAYSYPVFETEVSYEMSTAEMFSYMLSEPMSGMKKKMPESPPKIPPGSTPGPVPGSPPGSPQEPLQPTPSPSPKFRCRDIKDEAQCIETDGCFPKYKEKNGDFKKCKNHDG